MRSGSGTRESILHVWQGHVAVYLTVIFLYVHVHVYMAQFLQNCLTGQVQNTYLAADILADGRGGFPLGRLEIVLPSTNLIAKNPNTNIIIDTSSNYYCRDMS